MYSPDKNQKVVLMWCQYSRGEHQDQSTSTHAFWYVMYRLFGDQYAILGVY